MQEFTEIVENLGFPILICLFLLTRVEKKIESLSLSINQLTNILSSFTKQ